MNTYTAENSEQNPNTIWADLFVNELARCGLRDVCIAPGSRSSPLALAFFRNPDIQTHIHLDERSAAFFALGIALANDRPAALLCTSGTAGANFFPAIIESNMSQVPLLVLTADRPYELRHSGANQTVDQVKMYGDHVLWAVDIALPEKNPPEIALRNLRTLAARSYATANGLRKGPVHLNFPFRKPLEPQDAQQWVTLDRSDYQRGGSPFTHVEHGILRPSPDQLRFLTELISQNSEGLIVCGPRCPGGNFPQAVGQLAATCGYPIMADALSGIRFGPHTIAAPVCGAYETFLRNPRQMPAPRLILYFGAVPTSKRLNNYLAQSDSAYHVHIRENGIWADDNHRTTHFFQLDALELCLLLGKILPSRSESAWLELWTLAESRCWTDLSNAMERVEFDGAYVADIIDLLPEGSTLLAGNSLPVRHVDQFARPQKKALRVVANRGASGIDGNVSTGLGLAAGGLLPTAVLIGDITFYHDSNGLLALQHLDAGNVTFLVLNNDGGGIFQRLPISQFDPPFDQLFRVPHGLDLSSIARTYDLEYINIENRSALKTMLQSPLYEPKGRLIEIRTNAEIDNQIRDDIESQLRDSPDMI